MKTTHVLIDGEWWRRIRQHLGNAVARYVERLCSLASAHTFRASQTDLQI